MGAAKLRLPFNEDEDENYAAKLQVIGYRLKTAALYEDENGNCR